MRLVVLPGVFAPVSDSRLLAACLARGRRTDEVLVLRDRYWL